MATVCSHRRFCHCPSLLHESSTKSLLVSLHGIEIAIISQPFPSSWLQTILPASQTRWTLSYFGIILYIMIPNNKNRGHTFTSKKHTLEITKKILFLEVSLSWQSWLFFHHHRTNPTAETDLRCCITSDPTLGRQSTTRRTLCRWNMPENY